MNTFKYQVYLKPHDRDEELQIVSDNEEEALRAADYIRRYYGKAPGSDFAYVKKVSTEDTDEKEAAKFDTFLNLQYGYFH
ncbi:MAG: hypothetical protein PF439_05665 [Helicobacteraceae bacterium]|nr:hypothetical protein [Helicobacteraceae bacterium]